MQFIDHGNGFTLKLSARDTYDWTWKPGAHWPCSTLANKRLVACFDTNGLCDLTVNGCYPSDEIDGHELSAIVADHAALKLDRDHPCWFVAVGQFR